MKLSDFGLMTKVGSVRSELQVYADMSDLQFDRYYDSNTKTVYDHDMRNGRYRVTQDGRPFGEWKELE